MSMRLIGIHLVGVYLIGVHLRGMHLISVHLIGVHLMGVHLLQGKLWIISVTICANSPSPELALEIAPPIHSGKYRYHRHSGLQDLPYGQALLEFLSSWFYVLSSLPLVHSNGWSFFLVAVGSSLRPSGAKALLHSQISLQHTDQSDRSRWSESVPTT
jgi:hypothetical protein